MNIWIATLCFVAVIFATALFFAHKAKHPSHKH